MSKPPTYVIPPGWDDTPVKIEIGELTKEPNAQYVLLIEPGDVKKLLERCLQALNGPPPRALHITPKLASLRSV